MEPTRFSRKAGNRVFGKAAGASGGGRLTAYVLATVFVLLHLVLGNHISVFGAKPGFLLVLTASLAFMYGSRVGCIAGFACGLLFDLTGTGTVGLSSLLGSVAGYALGYRQRNAFSDGWKAPLMEFSLSALAYNALYYVCLLMVSVGFAADGGAVTRIVITTVLDIVVAWVAFAVLAGRFRGDALGSSGFRLMRR